MIRAGDPGIVTASGREVTSWDGVPSLLDIALSLSRQPRFAGHTRQWWSVLDHSLFVEELAERASEALGLDPQQSRALRLAGLLHDAHEALTGDVPTPFKSPGIKARQAKMDERIYDAYFPGGALAFAAFEPIVKDLDRRALLVEALRVGPLAFNSRSAVFHYFEGYPLLADVEAFDDSGLAGTEIDLRRGLDAPAICTFNSLYLTLR